MKRDILKFKVFVSLSVLSLFCCVAFSGLSEDEIKELAAKKKIREKTAQSFVVIHIHPKKNERPKPPDASDYSYYSRTEGDLQEQILAKQTVDFPGIIIDKEGRIFIADNYLDPNVIEKITVTGPDGKTLDAVQEKILVNTCGQIIRITGPLPEKWKVLDFVELPENLTIRSKLYSIGLVLPYQGHTSYSSNFTSYSTDEKESFFICRADPFISRANTSDIPDYFTICSSPAAVCDANGVVFGLTASRKVELGPEAMAWKGPDIIGDVGTNQIEGEKKINEQFVKYLYQVKLALRPPPKEEDEYDYGSYSSYIQSWYEGSETQKEMFIYGLAIAPDKVLLPLSLEREIVECIESITVQVADESVSASLAGALSECQAIVIQLNDKKLNNIIEISSSVKLDKAKPFWTVFGRELAGLDIVTKYNRWLDKAKGYENKWHPVLENYAQSGSWLLDKDGRFAGLYTGEKHPFNRILPYLLGENRRYYRPRITSFGQLITSSPSYSSYYGRDSARIFDTSYLESVIEDLPTHYDKYIRQVTKEEQKRRVWLGVEFTAINKETAKQLNLAKQTQDGRIGLMVNRVYPDSPAANLGIKEGDVLLKLKVPEAPWPIELIYEREYYSSPSFYEGDIPEEFESLGYRAPRKCPWPNRNNFLTTMLKEIGQDVPVKLTYVHEGRIIENEFVIEHSPPDSLSAGKYKDDKVGITIKDLSYEVRASLKLSPEDKAVVVSKVEEGTPAALARINAFELIRAVDNQQISSVKDFESVIKKAKEENKESVRVTVEWMGKTRLADLKFEAKAPNWKEMIRQVIPNIPGGSMAEE